jgi:hypothetical protein
VTQRRASFLEGIAAEAPRLAQNVCLLDLQVQQSFVLETPGQRFAQVSGCLVIRGVFDFI